MADRHESNAGRVKAIATDIVNWVEGSSHPVTLAEIEQHVPAFAQEPGLPSWSWETDDNNLLWDGMTEEGVKALQQVMLGAKVSVMPCSRAAYLLRGRALDEQKWTPIALAPAAAANFKLRGMLIAAPEPVLELVVKRARTELSGTEWRRLYPMFRL